MKMRWHLLLALLVAIVAAVASAQERSRVRCDVTIPTTSGDYKGYDKIAFKVMDGTGALGGTSVRLYDGQKLVSSLAADKDGLFSFRGLSPAKYRLVVRGWGEAILQVAPLSKARFVVNEFTLYTPTPNGCPTFVAGIG